VTRAPTEPSTKHATLWSEHLLRPTRHVYERSRDVKDCSGNVIAREHLFKCVSRQGRSGGGGWRWWSEDALARGWRV
jgi:hypothetical protein